MKDLKEYINKLYFDLLDEQLINHCNIYYAFNKEGFTEYFTFESLGLFNGCKEIVNYIIDHINDNESKLEIYSNNIKSLTNKYFNKLILIKDSNSQKSINGFYQSGYIDDNKNSEYDEQRWNKEKQIFNFISITLFNIDNSSENEIAEILTHELIHSWDDYILHLKSNSSLRNKSNSSLKKEFDKILENIRNKKVWCILSGDYEKSKEIEQKENEFESYILQLIYYLKHFEINAYIGQINAILRNKKFESINEAVDYIIKKSPSYNNYKYIYDIAFNDNDNLFIKYGASKSQLNQIRKLSNNAWKKIINHTYHICVDNLENKVNEGSSKILIKDKLIKIWKRK